MSVASSLINEKFTDLGNARRLVACYGKDLRFVLDWDSWLNWDGRRWRRVETNQVMYLAKMTIRSLDQQLPTIEDEDQRQLFRKHIGRSERASRLEAMVRLAKSEPAIAVGSEELDSAPNLLNCLSGTIDLRSGEIGPHQREDLITKLAPVDFEPSAQSEYWESFLQEATEGDSALQRYIQRAAGSTLFGANPDELLFILLGGTASGKSTFVSAISATLGDYARTATFETFLRSNQSGGARNDLARLKGARMVSAGEVAPGRQLDEATVKALTGGDTITARFLYGEHFEYLPQFTIWLHANHRPTVRDDDPAIWRRIRVIPFDHSVPEGQRDPSVKARLKDPGDGGKAVLAWLVKGALEWQEKGLGTAQAVEEATAAYRSEMATFGEFIEDRCIEGPGQWVASRQLQASYESWSKSQGYRYPYGPKRVAEVLRGRGHTPGKRGGTRGWEGIGLVQLVAKDEAA